MGTKYFASLPIVLGFLYSSDACAVTASSLFSELVKDVTVVTKKGSCVMNPYPHEADSSVPLKPACQPTTVPCPPGKTPLAEAIVKCKSIPSKDQDTIKQILAKAHLDDDVDYQKSASNSSRTAGCNPLVEVGWRDRAGYTPFCFFKRDGELVPLVWSWGEEYGEGWYFPDGTAPTIAEINNDKNYTCFPIDYQVIARCLTAPAPAALNKLDIKLK